MWPLLLTLSEELNGVLAGQVARCLDIITTPRERQYGWNNTLMCNCKIWSICFIRFSASL